jgi:MFS family permease
MSKQRIITKTILLLSFISLTTDIASEMLYPVMPVYLKSIGFSVILIGILEGLAESIAGFSKGYFGKISDTKARRAPFIRWGYGLSAISKPLMAVFTFPAWIFMSRTLDRIGKGVRTGARDAMLSDESTKENKGKVFGFHRAMDTVGAAIGPFAALIYLNFYPSHYKTMFLLAIFPGAIAIVLSMLLKDNNIHPKPDTKRTGFFSFTKYWKESDSTFKRLVAGLLAFTLFNSSDVFLLLAVKNAGFNDLTMIGIYIFYNLLYAFLSYPLGYLADKFGMKTILLGGFLVFSFVYFSMGFASELWQFGLIFGFYSLYAAATEGISKAWISNISPKDKTATAIGFYTGFASLFTFIASSLGGLLWSVFGLKTMFIFSAAGVMIVLIYLGVAVKK